MANVIPSVNMGMPIPVVGVDPGPDWANNVNACLSILDSHNHSPGQGNPITPSGMNISTDLDFLGNNAINLRSSRYVNQAAVLTLPTDLNCVYVVNGNLWYNNSAGVNVQITNGSSVAGSTGTITGLPSGTASASYQALQQKFLFQSATNVAASMDIRDLILRNATPGSPGLTLSAPTLGADQFITLPSTPAFTSVVTMDSSGVMSANNPYPPPPVPFNYQASAALNLFGINTTTITDVPSLSVTITASGSRPVFVGLTYADSGSFSGTSYLLFSGGTGQGQIFIVKDGVNIANFLIGGNSVTALEIPVTGISQLDFPTAGVHTYKIQMRVTIASSNTVQVQNVKLIAYEF